MYFCLANLDRKKERKNWIYGQKDKNKGFICTIYVRKYIEWSVRPMIIHNVFKQIKTNWTIFVPYAWASSKKRF